ncbi:DUF3962 domain-containing protein [Paenibacillus paeoniae]|uniref:DUF3893 domain-containing protein n=1 Tax=Paenibacillus paeoniae TaxID=2292705 RepID=A0A371PIV6_9BACL|nr:DUF3962 domain-containing protein [Paenibacillus paeoniae]REK76073.1 DUF3893 domain-containing protein [Paenibacillus paeoniae]
MSSPTEVTVTPHSIQNRYAEWLQHHNQSQALQPYQMEVSLDHLELTECYMLVFPVHYCKRIEERLKEVNDNQWNQEFQNVRWSSLRKMIMLDHGVSFFSEYSKRDKRFRVFAEEMVPLQQIIRTLREWHLQELKEPLGDLDLGGWEWIQISISEEMIQHRAYGFLPSLLHRLFCRQEHVIDGMNGNKPLRFHHVIKDTASTSVLSEPVWVECYLGPAGKAEKIAKRVFGDSSLTRFIKKKNNYFIELPISYELQTSLITKPFHPGSFFINFSVSLKRYAYWDVHNDLQYNGSASILIQMPSRYEDHNCSIMAETKLTKKGGAFNLRTETEYEIIRRFDRESGKVTFESFLALPYDHMRNDRDAEYRLFITYNTQYLEPSNMPIQAGIGLQERHKAFLTFADHFKMKIIETHTGNSATKLRLNRETLPYSPFIETTECHIDIWDHEEKMLFNNAISYWIQMHLLKDNKTYSVEDWSEAIQSELLFANAEAKKKNVSIHYHSANVNSHFSVVLSLKEFANRIKRTKDPFIASVSIDDTYTIVDFILAQHHLSVHFRFQTQGNITAAMITEESTRYGRIVPIVGQETKMERTTEIQTILQERNTNRIALIHIPPYHLMERSLRVGDPKDLIRQEFLNAGILTQFINNIDQRNPEFRLRSAVMDLFKHNGFYPKKLFENGWNENEIWLGVFSVKGIRENISHVVMTRIEYGKPPLFTLLNDSTIGETSTIWLETTDFLIFLRSKTSRSSATQQTIGTNCKGAIEDLISADKDIFAVFDYNLRFSTFPFLRNDSLSHQYKPLGITRDNVHFFRYNDSDEVPNADVIGINRKTGAIEITLQSGFYWDVSESLFYSMAAKSDSMKLENQLMKEDYPDTWIAKPNAREMIVLGEPDSERRKALCKKLHIMRNCLTTFTKEAADPLPFMYKTMIEKYLGH